MLLEDSTSHQNRAMYVPFPSGAISAENDDCVFGLNMFCQYINLWMYVIPAADLHRWRPSHLRVRVEREQVVHVQTDVLVLVLKGAQSEVIRAI